MEDPMELNFEGLEVQISTDRAQRVDEKNGVVCQVIMFTPRVMVFKISNMAIFLCFLLISHSLGNIFKYTWKILLNSSRKWYG